MTNNIVKSIENYSSKILGIVTPDEIAQAFEFVGGDSKRAVEAAQTSPDVNVWTRKQLNQVSWVGATMMLVPVLHIVTLIVDVWFLLHKMTYTCWGIAALHKCEPAGKADLEIILTHWSGELGDEMLDAAIATSAHSGLLGQSVLFAMIPEKLIVKIYMRYAERALQSMAVIFSKKMLAKTVGKVVVKKVGTKALTKVGMKVFAKFVLAFIPLVGVGVTVWINRYFVNSIAESADKYYAARRKYEIDLLQIENDHLDDSITED